MRQFCENCDRDVEYEVSIEKQEFNIRGLKVEVSIKVPKCKECGEEIYVKSIEKENDIIIYDAYKKAVGLLTSEEIKSIRKKRDLSQAEFAKLIQVGEKDITRYENGAIQTKSIDLLIRLVSKDDVYDKYIKPSTEKPTVVICSYNVGANNDEYKVKGEATHAKQRFVCCNA